MISRLSGTTRTGGEYSNSTGEEEEDWDRMDSDLDAAAIKAFGIVDGAYEVSAMVRGPRQTRMERRLESPSLLIFKISHGMKMTSSIGCIADHHFLRHRPRLV
jgi:hypothetical protein